MTATPNSERLHIAIFGKRNTGKSSVINAITGQNVALISSIAGTTTDPVQKAMELPVIGACVLIDTAGYDDSGKLGLMRVEKTKQILEKTDIAMILFCSVDMDLEKLWVEQLRMRKIPFAAVINKADALDNVDEIKDKIVKEFRVTPIIISAKERTNIDRLLTKLTRIIPEDYDRQKILPPSITPHSTVMLVMPQDESAPKGRLILPQVQTIRELIDNNNIVISVNPAEMDNALGKLSAPPDFIITDSQVFDEAYLKKPPESELTSFSVLFASYKGDKQTFLEGTEKIDSLKESDCVLIAEACTHAPQDNDIARVKIPKLLRKKAGENLQIEVVCGSDFPTELSKYALIIHCGGCMYNRRFVMNRIQLAKSAGVPITNYGMVLAKMNGILDKIML